MEGGGEESLRVKGMEGILHRIEYWLYQSHPYDEVSFWSVAVSHKGRSLTT